jgi:hypothetical protein
MVFAMDNGQPSTREYSMQQFLSQTQAWRLPFWLGLLIVSSIAFTFAFACAMPYAALAAATALTLPRRDALFLIGGIWLANQLIGFLFLHYPFDTNTLLWGAALGIVAFASLFAARITAARLRHMNPLVCCTLAFLTAFIAYEASCFWFALVLGGREDFTLAIQTRILAINVCALIGLFAVNHVGASLRLVPKYGTRSLASSPA